MTRSLTRWIPVLLLRDVLGRFVKVRVDQGQKAKRPARRRPMRQLLAAVQLVLF